MLNIPKHPEYDKKVGYWDLCLVSYEGEAAVKACGKTYLPATSGQLIDWNVRNNEGRNSYDAYVMRSVYPEDFKDAILSDIGKMHRKPPTIKLPTALEAMRENASINGESLEAVLMNINAAQLITGRVGILGDVVIESEVSRPVVVTYNEKSIVNWDDAAVVADNNTLRMVLLNESHPVIDDASLKWTDKEQYRIIALIDNGGNFDSRGNYAVAVIEGDVDTVGGLDWVNPNVMGSNLDVIPFAFINSSDIATTPDMPPLIGLANRCMSIYRKEADYNQGLFMQGQDTLVTIGEHPDDDFKTRTGAGAKLEIPLGGDAKYIGVSSGGLSELRQGVENGYNKARELSGRLADISKSKESGEALGIRVSAQSATLNSVAKAGSTGLEKVLKIMAEWYGANPDEVVIEPNLDFVDKDLAGSAESIVKIQTAKGLGAKISDESIHARLVESGWTQKEFDEEVALTESESI